MEIIMQFGVLWTRVLKRSYIMVLTESIQVDNWLKSISITRGEGVLFCKLVCCMGKFRTTWCMNGKEYIVKFSLL